MPELDPQGASPGALHASSIEEACRLFQEAEQVVKRIERIDGGLIIPAINQLRYAGHHLVKFQSNPETHPDDLGKATGHCKRALYDAYEAGITYCLLELKKFQDDYKKVEIIPVFTGYAECCNQANEALKLVETIIKDSRENYYKDSETYFDKLLPHIQKIPTYREELNKKICQERKTTRRFIVTIVVSGTILLFTMVKFVVGDTLQANSKSIYDQNSSSVLPPDQSLNKKP